MIETKEVEDAIDEINGVIMDFSESIDSLKKVKSLLERLLEAKYEAEEMN
jgi:hypothetical protein